MASVPSETPFSTAHCWATAYHVAPPSVSTPLARARMVQNMARVSVPSGSKSVSVTPFMSPAS